MMPVEFGLAVTADAEVTHAIVEETEE
jgi:hypothetical protein